MKRVSPYLKMRVLGAIEFAPGNSIIARIKHVAQTRFLDEDGVHRQFTWRTIQTWYSRYKKNGITTMQPKPRGDKGKPRKVEPEKLQEAIEHVLPAFRSDRRRLTIAAVYRECIERNLLRRDEVAPNTFRRIVNSYELLKPEAKSSDKRRLAFAKAHANEMWQADTMFGPYVQHGTRKLQSKLIAFIDDASRLCCHAQFFTHENTTTLLAALRSALYKRGVPEALYVDNGSIYTSKEITRVCARVGCLLCHAPVRDGAAKGKVERFFRTVRDKFLIRRLDLSSVDALNREFSVWVENDYNDHHHHSALQMKPIDRFGFDLSRIRFLPPNEVNDELFWVEHDRTVLADNTFSVQRLRLECPRDLRSRKVQVRFDRKHLTRIAVFCKGERMGEARPLDRVANDRKPKAAKENAS